MVTPLSALDSVSKVSRLLRAVDDDVLDIRNNALTTVVGCNGARKTSLFNLITGRYWQTGKRIELTVPADDVLHDRDVLVPSLGI